MAEFTGSSCLPGDTTEIYSRTAIQLGTRAFDTDGNQYIFLRGVASTVAGSWVTYDSNSEFDTTLLVTGAIGPVAVAQAAIVAGKFGWYCIWGLTTGCAQVTAADDDTLDVTGSIGRSIADGYVGNGATAGDVIYGVVARSAMEAASGNTSTLFQINYPFVDAQTAGH